MEIGVIGLPLSGKTTLFNALTRGHAQVAAYSQSGKPNVGVVKVPDSRLDILYSMYEGAKYTPAEVIYTDIPGAPEGLGKTESIGGEYLNRLQMTAALLHVVRAFEDPSIPHLEDGTDPYRDLTNMDMELSFSDLAILERRLSRLEDGLKAAKSSERDGISREQEFLERIKGNLEKEIPLRGQEISLQEAIMLQNYQFLTAKPLLVALNIDEGKLAQACDLERELESRAIDSWARGIIICGKLESELAQMKEAEEKEFRESMGLGESGLKRMLRLSYDVLGMISFFTIGEDEVKAWSIMKGTDAVRAAGKIHSDIERGFIRAEVISFDDLVNCGSLAKARKQGLLRHEGKTYQVKDGDVINFLFNV